MHRPQLEDALRAAAQACGEKEFILAHLLDLVILILPEDIHN